MENAIQTIICENFHDKSVTRFKGWTSDDILVLIRVARSMFQKSKNYTLEYTYVLICLFIFHFHVLGSFILNTLIELRCITYKTTTLSNAIVQN